MCNDILGQGSIPNFNGNWLKDDICNNLKKENAELKAEINKLRNDRIQLLDENREQYNELLNEKYKLEQEVSRLTQAIVNIALKI